MHDEYQPSIRPKLKAKDLKHLSERRAYPWIRDALADWLVIAIAFIAVAVFPNPLTVFAAVLVVGNRQHALALMGHDGTHFTISYNRKINDPLTNLLTWVPLGLTLDGYRNLHKFHHQFLGTESDPEVVYKGMKAEEWDLPATLIDVLKVAAKDLLGFGISDYKTIVVYSKPTRQRSYLPLAAFHILGSAGFVAAGLWWVPALWYLCLPTSFIMFFRLRLWLEHHGTDYTHRLKLNWWQGALLAPHLSWHHWEHHYWPSIPYYHLAGLRKLVPDVPVMSLGELIAFYRDCAEVRGGTALKALEREQASGVQNPAFN